MVDERRIASILGQDSMLRKLLTNPTAEVTYTHSHSGEVSHRATPQGVSEEHYCLDCCSKHLGTAKILLREALQRADKGEPKEAILAKVRGAYEELMGAEDDSQALSDERIRQLNSMIRDTRKWFFNSGVITEVDKSKIVEAFNKVSKLNDEVYKELEVRKERLKEFLQKTKEKIEQLQEKLEQEKHAK
jgi:gas vesicle protein